MIQKTSTTTIDIILAKTFIKNPHSEEKEPKFLAYVGTFGSARCISGLTEKNLADKLQNRFKGTGKEIRLTYEFCEQRASELIPSPVTITKREYEKIAKAYSASGL